MSTLFIYPRRGLYQLTKCDNCGHLFDCSNCDAKLVTYRQYKSTLELVCHQCQTYYKYPETCPACNSYKIFSRFGGIEELVETIEKEKKVTVVRLDNPKTTVIHTTLPLVDKNSLKNIQVTYLQEKGNLLSSHILEASEGEIYVSTRLFDPSLSYSNFSQIVFVQAHHLLASPDYLVQEEIMKSIAEVLLRVDCRTKVIFDTNSTELELFKDIIKLNKDYSKPEKVYDWYIKFLNKETESRKKYHFPPFKNLLLLTTQEKNLTHSKNLLVAVKNYLETMKDKLPEVHWSSPYPARFLKRRNLFSHHLLIRYPKQYKHFNLLKKEVMSLSEVYKLQVRLNPRHLF